MSIKEWNERRAELKARLAQIDEQLKPPTRAEVRAGYAKDLSTADTVKLRVERARIVKDLAATIGTKTRK